MKEEYKKKSWGIGPVIKREDPFPSKSKWQKDLTLIMPLLLIIGALFLDSIGWKGFAMIFGVAGAILAILVMKLPESN